MKKEEKIFTVSEFLGMVNEVLTLGFPKVCVQGEVSQAQAHPTGFYFSLKDSTGVLGCYFSPSQYRVLGFSVSEGMEVKVYGAPGIYVAKGRFSFVVQNIELFGEGSLRKAYEALKSKIEAEGLTIRKRPLPEFIHTIGLVTSKTGAVIHDFQKNLSQLGFSVQFYDARVEGANAVSEVSSGIRFFNELPKPPEVIVIIRGGGSLEDLQAFNNEVLVREIFSSKIPTLCGIGHDKDVPLACLVSDVAVSTPTATAHFINASWEALVSGLPLWTNSILYSYSEILNALWERIRSSGTIMSDSLSRIFALYKERLLSIRMYLRSVDPQRNLRLGYSIVRLGSGRVVTQSDDVSLGDVVNIRVSKGGMDARVTKKLE